MIRNVPYAPRDFARKIINAKVTVKTDKYATLGGKKERKRKMLRYCDFESGEATRLYRDPGEIRRDMDRINSEIKRASAMFNIRNMLIELLIRSEGENEEKTIEELELLVEEAKSALEELTELKNSLSGLCEELEETRWEMGIR